jgi:Leucine-rich repeat
LQNNILTSLQGIQGLTQLEHLDVSVNKLSSLDELSSLRQVTMLSFDHNCISTLSPLFQLTALMEVYARSNHVHNLAELQPLYGLEHLLVLDLLGNPLCASRDYKDYTIFRLRQLRALDGEAISAAAQTTARNKFAGRLTIELLEESAGPTDWSR